MDSVSLYLFGAPHLEADGQGVPVARRKALALLAYLAGTERAHSRDTLATLLWPERDGTTARAALRRVLVTANKAVGKENLSVEQDRIGLATDEGLWVDVRRFRQALKQSRLHGHTHLHQCDECLGWLTEAAELYQDDFLAGFSLTDTPEFDDWQTVETESLRRDAGEVLEKLASIHAAPRDFAQAIHCARRWLALDPLQEAAHQMLMRLYAWSGDQTSALRQYWECTELLQRELGVPPQAETTELYEWVKAGQIVLDGPLTAASFPAQSVLAQAGERRIRLPRLFDFVGRGPELAALTELLADSTQRLVTIVGMGGMGKTFLAVAAAAQAADSFPDGAVFVPLAPLSQPSAIVYAMAEALNFTFPPDSRPPRQQLLGYLATRHLLLVLDNFEHLLDDGVQIVAELLQGAPHVSFLVTSRQPLNLRVEVAFALEGMPVGNGEADAVHLFVRSARRVLPGYTPQSADLATIGDICRLVGGMPLGVVMAAGWMKMLSAQEIATEIQRRPDLLQTELRDVPARQQSMRTVLEQSWKRLEKEEQNVLMRVSLFQGDFTRDAALDVSHASLHTLLVLSNRQLLKRNPEGRYEIHELLRQFAQERLHEAALQEAVTQAHATYFLGLLERSETELKGADQLAALDRLTVEHENVRVAWIWALAHGAADDLNRAAEALCLFYFLKNRLHEGADICLLTEGQLVKSAPESRTYARILVWHAALGRELGQATEGKERCRHSLEMLDRLAAMGQDVRAERAFALATLGGLLWYDDMAANRQLLAESWELCRALDDRWQMAHVLRELARIPFIEGDYPLSEERVSESLRILQSMGDQLQSLHVLSALCYATLNQSQTERAMAYAREQRQMGEKLGLHETISFALFNIGYVHSYRGEYGQAQIARQEALTIAESHGLRHHANSCRWQLSLENIHLGHYPEAYTLAQFNLTDAHAIGLHVQQGHAFLLLGMIHTAWERYPEAHGFFDKGIHIIQTVHQPRFLAEANIYLAYMCYGAGDKRRALHLLTDSLDWTLAHQASQYVSFSLPLAALFLADGGQPERAVELYALAMSHPRIANSRWFYDVAGRELDVLATELPTDAVVAAQKRGQALDLFVAAQQFLDKTP